MVSFLTLKFLFQYAYFGHLLKNILKCSILFITIKCTDNSNNMAELHMCNEASNYWKKAFFSKFFVVLKFIGISIFLIIF